MKLTIRIAVFAATIGAMVGTLVAARGWSNHEAAAFLGGLALVTIAVLVIGIIVLPGPLKLRLIAAGVALVIIAATVGWLGIVQPRRAVAAEFRGSGISWSRSVPDDWQKEDNAAGNGGEPVRIGAVLGDRAVLLHGNDLLIVDLATGNTISSIRINDLSSSEIYPIARTADGFVVRRGRAYSFFDRDGKELGEPVRGDALIARAAGVSVVLDCRGDCTASAIADGGKRVWTQPGYQRPSRRTAPITDQSPAYGLEGLDVVPDRALLLRAEEGQAKIHTFDQRDLNSGKIIRTLKGLQVGSDLGVDGHPSSVFVVGQSATNSDCVVSVWNEAPTPMESDSFACSGTATVIGRQVIFEAGNSSRLVSQRIDLDDPRRAFALSPEARVSGGGDQPLLVHDTGSGGFALAGVSQLGGLTTSDQHAVTGGTWGTPRAERWTSLVQGYATVPAVGARSVVVAGHDLPAQGVWDRPAEEDWELTVLSLANGNPIGHLRIAGPADDIWALPDGSVLVAVDHKIVKIARV